MSPPGQTSAPRKFCWKDDPRMTKTTEIFIYGVSQATRPTNLGTIRLWEYVKRGGTKHGYWQNDSRWPLVDQSASDRPNGLFAAATATFDQRGAQK